MDKAEKLIQQAEAAQERYQETLRRSGLTTSSLKALAERLRRKLPQIELQRIEKARQALLPQERRRPGTSKLTIPIGIRG